MGEKQEPLTESYFYILLCLYNGAKHGYGIMQEAAKISEEHVKIGSGTMYGAINNMLKKKWIMETVNEDSADSRKRLYSLTKEGERVLLNEILRLRRLLQGAQQVIGGQENEGQEG